MEELKPLDQICKPDPRHELLVRIDRKTGTMTPLRVEDLYADVEMIRLRDGVPEPIRSQFNIARNLLVYTWFVYGFAPVSELYAFGALEQALKERGRSEKLEAELEKKRDFLGLRFWLKYAVDHAWLKDEDIDHCQHTRMDNLLYAGEMGLPLDEADLHPGPQDYCKLLADTFPHFRNSLAHGHGMIYPPRSLTLEICADLINQLFPDIRPAAT